MKGLRKALRSERAKTPFFIAFFIAPWVSIGAGVELGGSRAAIAGTIGAVVIVFSCLVLMVIADSSPRPKEAPAHKASVKEKFENWYWLLHEDPEAWVVRTSGMGMLLFFVLSKFVPHRAEELMTGAGLLCAAVFWLFLIMGMAGWP